MYNTAVAQFEVGVCIRRCWLFWLTGVEVVLRRVAVGGGDRFAHGRVPPQRRAYGRLGGAWGLSASLSCMCALDGVVGHLALFPVDQQRC